MHGVTFVDRFRDNQPTDASRRSYYQTFIRVFPFIAEREAVQ